MCVCGVRCRGEDWLWQLKEKIEGINKIKTLPENATNLYKLENFWHFSSI
jgi:hypothetical protein